MSALRELRECGVFPSIGPTGGVFLPGKPPDSVIALVRAAKEDILAELNQELIEQSSENENRIRMCLGLEKALAPLVVESGDQADQALSLVRSFLAACRGHSAHGVKWHMKYGDELGKRLEALRPLMFPIEPEEEDRYYEGAELVAMLYRIWPEGSSKPHWPPGVARPRQVQPSTVLDKPKQEPPSQGGLL